MLQVSILSTALVALVALFAVAQAQFFRPFPLAMNAFSAYHPARINQETLPISQAEFAQLVAESMATSHGPHHHHPPNTDQDYEGPDHYRGHHEQHQPHPHHHHRHHEQGGYHHPPAPNHGGYRPYHRPDYHQAEYENNHNENRHHQEDNEDQSQYQPEERYRNHGEEDSGDQEQDYRRAPVYENNYPNENNNADNNEEDDSDNQTYGGNVGNDNYDNYEPQGGYEDEESRPYPRRF